HLDEQRIQRLLALVVAAAQTCTAIAAHSVDFINENNAKRILFALLEEIAHAAGADADKHFHEVRTGNREERNVRFTGDDAREKRLARARRANQQNAFQNTSAKFLEFLQIFQEFDNFLQFFFDFIDSRNIFESGFLLLSGKQPHTG